MNMPKSRDMQVKIPSPKAIFHGFLLVTVRVLNSYNITIKIIHGAKQMRIYN